MKPIGDIQLTTKKRSLYIYSTFFIIAILSTIIVIWKTGILA